VVDAPVHFGWSKVVLAAVGRTAGFHAETSSLVPVEVAPVSAVAKNLGSDEILVLLIVNLLA
jgi:hypothetical protein